MASLIEARRRILLSAPHLEAASGDIAAFKTDLTLPLKSLVVDIPVTQSGTGDPSPENARPFVGRAGAEIHGTGENIFGGTLLRDGIKAAIPSATVNEDEKAITFNAAAAAFQSITTESGLDNRFKENTRYTFLMTFVKTSGAVHSNLRIFYTDGSYTNIASLTDASVKQTTVTVSAAGKTVAGVRKTNASGNTKVYYEESGIFEGVLTADDFASYIGNQISVNWEDEAGTVYGGTLTVNVDGSCDIQPTKAEMDLGSLTWTYLTNGAYPYFRSGRVDAIKGTTGIATLACSNYLAIYNRNYTDFRAHDYNNQICCSRQTGYTTVTVQDSRYTDAEAFKTAVTGVTIVYDLATLPSPIHIDNIGQLYTYLGTNNIWCDAGTTTVKYWTH